MTPRSKIAITLGLLVLLGGLGAADYYVNGDEYTAQLQNGENTGSTSSNDNAPGVAKNTGPDVQEIAQLQGFTTQDSNDLSLVSQVVTDGTPVESLAILKDGDRAGSVTWVASPKVKDYFIALKEALLSAFSTQVRDLRDEVSQLEGKPVRNILTFIDPTLSEERIVFVRVRERLYEFHVAAGKEDTMNVFIEELTLN